MNVKMMQDFFKDFILIIKDVYPDATEEDVINAVGTWDANSFKVFFELYKMGYKEG